MVGTEQQNNLNNTPQHYNMTPMIKHKKLLFLFSFSEVPSSIHPLLSVQPDHCYKNLASLSLSLSPPSLSLSLSPSLSLSLSLPLSGLPNRWSGDSPH